MAPVRKKSYVAKTGITFNDGTKSQADLKEGDPIPANIDQKTIDELLAIKAIEEAK